VCGWSTQYSMYELLQESWAINSSPSIRTPPHPSLMHTFIFIFGITSLIIYPPLFPSTSIPNVFSIVYNYVICPSHCCDLVILCLSMLRCLSVRLLPICFLICYFYLSVCLFLCLPCLFVCMFVFSVCLYVCFSVCLFLYLYVCLSACLSVCISVCLSA
jgi:hypothetical protein